MTPTPKNPAAPAAPVAPGDGFNGLGIAPDLLNALKRCNYSTPTPIQKSAIPPAIQGQDLIGIAQTGTGKTLAFSIPMLQRLAALKARGLVILPTRELALQVDEVLQKIGKSFGLRTAVLIGGASMHVQKMLINKKPHVIVATPGRLIDHLDQRTLTLSDVKILVLDEADRMLDMGFAPQIARILSAVPKDRQTMLFSATMPAEITKIATQHMKIPTRIEIARPGTAAQNVSQEMFFVNKEDKIRLLQSLLSEYKGTVLVFTRTKHGAAKVTRQVRQMGHTVAEIHSNRSLNQRRDALSGFKSGRYRILVATDIAARGIDVTGIEVVINFDLPDHTEDYVHRIGRTGRAGMTGRAISFATFDQRRDVRDIERLVRSQLPIRSLPSLPPAMKPLPGEPKDFERSPRPFRGGRPGYGSRPGGSRPGYGSRPGGHGGHSRPSGSGSSHVSTKRPPRSGGGRPQGGRPARGPRTFYGGMGV